MTRWVPWRSGTHATDAEVAAARIAFQHVKGLLRQPGRRRGDQPIPVALTHLSESQRGRWFAWKADALLREVFARRG